MRFRFRFLVFSVLLIVLIVLVYYQLPDRSESSEPDDEFVKNSADDGKDRPRSELDGVESKTDDGVRQSKIDDIDQPNDDSRQTDHRNLEEDDSPKSAAMDSTKSTTGNNYSTVNYNVHIFYYPWYGNPTFDNGSYYHWNHNILPGPGQKDWKDDFRYRPPDDIGANFYPKLGCYSSRDPSAIAQHFEWIRSAGIGTVVVSWYPPSQSTDQGHTWDDLVPRLLDTADRYSLKIAFHIEPYKNRNVENLRENFDYIIRTYGGHSAFYRYSSRPGKIESKPFIYVYDSYLIRESDWRQLLTGQGRSTIRRSALDSYVIGLLVQGHELTTLITSGFDGFYTYFAANGFSYGSTWKNWKSLAHGARRSNKLFVPSVGPGYIDESVRPWNKENTHSREQGRYYTEAWRAATNARPSIVAITSFNEWHEGTQIEPAVPHVSSTRTYSDYTPFDPLAYLRMTKDWVDQVGKSERSRSKT